MIQRELSKKLLEASKLFPVIAIFGPRQAGKTTLSKSIFANYTYKNLEDPSEREFAVSDPKSFLNQNYDGMIIDEIQRVPELFSYIQVIVDKNKNAKFVITGSQNYLLMENITQSLAGRVYLSRLLPFSVQELNNIYEPINVNEIIYKGFFPPIYDRNIPISDWMPSYIQTYLERDVRQIKNITNLDLFSRFIQLCAGRTGQLMNISSIGNEIGVTDNTIKSWFSVLEASFIIYMLKPFYKNFNKRIVKSRKLYFIDSGLASSLLNIRNINQMETHFLKGGLFENLVIIEVLKYFFNKGEIPQLYYWRDNKGNEIDLILEIDNKLFAIEIKASQTISSHFFYNLNYFEKIVDKTEIKKIIVYSGYQYQYRNDIHIIPWNRIADIFN